MTLSLLLMTQPLLLLINIWNFCLTTATVNSISTINLETKLLSTLLLLCWICHRNGSFLSSIERIKDRRDGWLPWKSIWRSFRRMFISQPPLRLTRWIHLTIINLSLFILSNFFILLTFLVNIRPQQLVMNIRNILKILQYPAIIY